jgi:hypothetical protein
VLFFGFGGVFWLFFWLFFELGELWQWQWLWLSVGVAGWQWLWLSVAVVVAVEMMVGVAVWFSFGMCALMIDRRVLNPKMFPQVAVAVAGLQCGSGNG